MAEHLILTAVAVFLISSNTIFVYELNLCYLPMFGKHLTFAIYILEF